MKFVNIFNIYYSLNTRRFCKYKWLNYRKVAESIVKTETNLVPVIEAVHRVSPDKEIGVMFPLRRYNNSLEKAADFAITMRGKMLSHCQLPDKIIIGNMTIERPGSWR